MARADNKHGLKDYIPADVKRAIRRACGFGCVICGGAIAQYEHIDPPFENATSHDPERMALLCGTCHDKVTRGLLSKSSVTEARRRPFSIEHGRAHDAFDIKRPFHVRVGSSVFRDINCIVRTATGERWLAVEDAEEADGPIQVSARFYDDLGALGLEIEKNEWRCLSSVWDCEVVGPAITLRRAAGDIVLVLVAEPPNGLWLQRLHMRRDDLRIDVYPDGESHWSVQGITVRMRALSVQTADSVFTIG